MARWAKITEYEMYSVSDDGRVRNDKTNRILKQSINSCGYLYVQLSKNGIQRIGLIHRLVCKAFVENTENKAQVDHIDGNKFNNCAYNLRWVTASENRTAYGNQQRTLHRMRKVLAKSEDGKTMLFDSRMAVAKHFGCSDTKVKYGYSYKKGNKKGWAFYKVEDIV